MKTIAAIVLLIGISLSAHAMTAFFEYETESGMNKICYYSSPQGTHAITIKSYQLCPLTIQV